MRRGDLGSKTALWLVGVKKDEQQTGQQPAAVSEKAACIESGLRRPVHGLENALPPTATPENCLIPSENKMVLKKKKISGLNKVILTKTEKMLLTCINGSFKSQTA